MALRFLFLAVVILTFSGVHAQSSELDTEGIILTCTDSQMEVEIPKSLLTGEMAGTNVRFENTDDADDEYCHGVDVVNDDGVEIIQLTTNLTACGTNRTESETEETYTNRVISNYGSTEVISRQFAVDIPLSCSYNRSQRVDSAVRYQLTDYTIDKTLEEEGAYTFSFDIFTDDTYETAVDAYPLDIGLNEELYFAAAVQSLDGTLDLSIRACRATPTSKYDGETFFDFIEDACSTDGDDTNITYITDFNIGVEINTFRFIDEGDMVYLHCDLLVCDAGNADSLCKQRCVSTASAITGRKRRDVNGAYNTKRFTRGPMRVARAAESRNGVSRMDFSDNGISTHQEEVTSAFNPWMVAIAAMATVVMAMAAMMTVVLRKVNKLSSSPRRGTGKEEAVHLLTDDTDEI